MTLRREEAITALVGLTYVVVIDIVMLAIVLPAFALRRRPFDGG